LELASATNAPRTAAAGFTSLLEISNEEFLAFRDLIYRESGINLSEAKRALICSRLSKRLRHLGLGSYSEYLDYLQSHDASGSERQQMINCITTNKTEFFRESHHFDFLRDKLFPIWQERARTSGKRQLRIWSAACSTGEEPYTIAMTLADHFENLAAWDAKILATDIDTDVLARAQAGIYSLDRMDGIEEEVTRRNFLRGTGGNAGKFRIRPQVQRLVSFRQINFVDDVWPIRTKFDAIFCRNALIYFNRETQQKIVNRLIDHLAPGGHLFLGHSENADWLTERLTVLGQTVYRPRGADGAERLPRLLRDVRVPEVKRPARISPSRLSLPSKNIIAGEVMASRDPLEIRTTLGSCVAACLYDPTARVGGMNHFVLPERAGDSFQAQSLGVHAMELLINWIMSLGGQRSRLRAKLFGGGQMFAVSSSKWNVGEKNTAFIRQFCQTERIPIESQQLGGANALVVRFHTETGKALVKPIDRQLFAKLAPTEETDASRLLQPEKIAGEITLF
jgi:chemotaxis protein methyltransferase CheR